MSVLWPTVSNVKRDYVLRNRFMLSTFHLHGMSLLSVAMIGIRGFVYCSCHSFSIIIVHA